MGALIAGILSVTLWAVMPAIVKGGAQNIDPSLFLLFRFSVSLALLSWLLPGVLKKVRDIPSWLWIGMAINLGANFYFQTIAMTELPVSWYIVIFSLNPIFALVLLRVKWSRRLVAGVSTSAIGTLLFLNAAEMKTPVATSALVCLVIGMLTWVIYTIGVVRFQKVYSDIQITAVTQALAFLAIGATWVLKGAPTASISSQAAYSGVLLGVSIPAAYFFFSYCLRRLPIFGIVGQYLEPVIGIAAGCFFFHETLTFTQMIGTVAILIGTASLSKLN